MTLSLKEIERVTLSEEKGHNVQPEHMARLWSDEWGLWRWICLRAAGFSGQLVDELASPRCASSAEDLLLREKDLAEIRQAVLSDIRRELDVAADPERRKHLAQSITDLKKGKLPGETACSAELWQKLPAAQSRWEEALARFRKEFQIGMTELSHNIRIAAADPRFREAVLLQNREALHHGIDSLVRQSEGKRGKKQRQQEQLVANYLQRYCVKNDSIGFFGPIGWARAVSEGPALDALPGQDLISETSIYFERWCIQELADHVTKNELVLHWVAPRQLPGYHLHGSRLHVPGARSVVLPDTEAIVLNRCRGDRTARQIARELMYLDGSGINAEQDCYGILKDLAGRGIIAWTIELPLEPHPERRLRKILESIADPSLRDPAIAGLNELEAAREAIARACGDADRLDQAIGSLEEKFVQLTGKAATRSSGQMYAARTLIYQDCRRDVKVEIGPELLEKLGEPLSFLLKSARWFTYRSAELCRDAFQRIYEQLAGQTHSHAVELARFWSHAQEILIRDERVFDLVLPEYQQRWNDLLCVDPLRRRMEFCSSDLRERLADSFAAPSAGWQCARYHSPDVMVGASGADAIRRGEYFLVLGEMHMAANTLRGNFAMSQHPCPKDMFQALKADLPEPRIVPVPPFSWPGITIRTAFGLISEDDYHLEVSNDSLACAARSRVVAINEFEVVPSAGGLIVCSRDGRLKFDIIEFFGEMLSSEALNYMKIVRSQQHIPRITIDALVVVREAWTFSAAAMHFVQEPDEPGRFLRARHWAEEHNLPRWVFVKMHVEVKPFYVDFDSPVYVEIFCKIVRRVLASDAPDKPITVSEMLPRPGELWLSDSKNLRYTSEFRMVVFDRVG